MSQKFSSMFMFISFLLALIFSKVLGPNFGPVFFLIYTALLLSIVIPSRFLLQRVAISVLLVIGLTPFYLILRGFVANSPLNSWDFQLYLIIFQIIAYRAIFKHVKFKNLALDLKINSRFIFSGFANLFFALIVIEILKSRTIGDAVAWIGSGDSKNHLVNGVEITQFGFLDPTTFWIQPVSAPSYLSLIFAQENFAKITAVEALQQQMLSYAYVWILLIGLVGLSFTSLFEIIWRDFFGKKSFPPVFSLIMVSLIPTLSFFLGSALFDGFFTAILGVSSLIVLIGWFIEFNQNKVKELKELALGFNILVVTVLSWMFVLPFSLLLFLFSLRIYINTKIRHIKIIDFFFLTIILTGALIVHFSSAGQSFIYRVKLVLNTEGVANVTNPNLFVALLAFLIILSLLFHFKGNDVGQSLLVITVVQIVALYGFKYFSNLGITKWNYYLLKYQWIMFVTLSSVVLAVGISSILVNFENKLKVRVLATFLVFISVFFVSESIVNSNSNRVWIKVWRGWDNPRAKTMNAVFEQDIDYKNPTMFFHYGYAGESMMANFWLNSFADPRDPIKGWNYTIDTTGDPKQLCDVNAYYPEVSVVTSDIKLEEALTTLCPDEKFMITLEPPLYE